MLKTEYFPNESSTEWFYTFCFHGQATYMYVNTEDSIYFTDLGFNGNGRKSWSGSGYNKEKILGLVTRNENMKNNFYFIFY